MQPIGANAQLLSNDVLAKWLIEDFPFRIQLSSIFPFLSVSGHSLRYATTGPLIPGAAIGQNDTIPEDTKQPADPNRVHRFAEIATHFRVSYKAQDIFSSNVNDQVAVQMALAVRELLYRFWILFERGDTSTNPEEFDGLLRLVNPDNTIDLQGRALTLEDLDSAKELVRANDGRCIVIFTSSIGKRAINASHYVRGLRPASEEMEFTCPDGTTKFEHVLKFDGAPVYINDLNQIFECSHNQVGAAIPPERVLALNGTEPPLATNIWFFSLGPGSLHGIKPEKAQSIITRSTILADASTLVYHLAMPVGIALGSSAALSVIRHATIPGCR
ncbi:hypothetical protein SAMN05421690_100728 [Nitrosomonas sp. Nm51]|uniref:hypothetical protein n=1 Tax=Nitrosomonas sp. Nm51 TaxID=133720 RepID=UPI0008D327B1|nr:hypothetical protein [Nitrosomonas sp. Nm51]SER06347.1 hypothetical protein SAMN05421690_100728 [Nitrosomonas sp. Nm51]